MARVGDMTATQNNNQNQTVTMFFDAICPFAWVTSRWLMEVQEVRDVEVKFQPMSLSVLNEGRDLDPAYREKMDAAWAPARVATAIWQQHPEKLSAWYTAIGTKIHNEERADATDPHGYDELIAEALEEAELPAELSKVGHLAADDEGSVDAPLRESQDKAIELVGDEVGTPVVQLGDVAFFGPVITRIPRGEEAGKMFDASVTLAANPHFFELKRSRTEAPVAE